MQIDTADVERKREMETATQPKFITCRNCDTIHSGDKWAGSDCAKGRCVSPAPVPQETPAQQSPTLKAVSYGAIEGPDGFTIQIENSRGAYQPEWIAFRDLIIRSVNRDPAFQKLVEVTRMVEAWLSSRKDLTERLRASGDTLANTSSHEMDILDKAREALRLAREGEE